MRRGTLLAISDRRRWPGDGSAIAMARWAERLAAAGVGALQFREKDADDREAWSLLVEIRRAWPRERPLLVNGRLDLALAAEADGVHLPGSGVPTATLRGHACPRFLLGRSTHSVSEIDREAEAHGDYVTYGPVNAVAGKAPPVGIEGLREATGRGLPVFALGGVGPEDCSRLAEAGAAGAAGIRGFLTEAGARRWVEAAAEAWAS